MFELKVYGESIIPAVPKIIYYRQVNLSEFWPQPQYEEKYYVQNLVRFFLRQFAMP